ncbi:MAG: lysine transporter LysE [Sneathiella sp.]|jgi:threonine/homoserine/homoserine lactone efflux protein|uniref:LysE family translocator n=1 Tax=Sneathiella sp. TaxID=1964365 RepID=UPI000C4FC0BA|nr:LysE family translocator [Sneathiella sp.]MAL80351.1 lysine transporter LysE [Sneathiella sp.]
MSLEIWISFVLASGVLLAIPGPTLMIVISYALSGGRRTALATMPGVALGDLTAMTISLLGAGAVLAASATLFTLLKVAGALYLVWLGFRLWRAEGGVEDVAARAPRSPLAMFRTAYIVTALNPKGIVFFVAFVPQFVNVNEPAFVQFAILEATFVTLAAVNVLIWAFLAGTVKQRFASPGAVRLMNRTGAGFLIAAGLLTALVRRTA